MDRIPKRKQWPSAPKSSVHKAKIQDGRSVQWDRVVRSGGDHLGMKLAPQRVVSGLCIRGTGGGTIVVQCLTALVGLNEGNTHHPAYKI